MNKMLRKAFDIAVNAHTGQVRKYSHFPYIVHPLNVALTLKRLGMDDDVVVAGLLHDTLEDTSSLTLGFIRVTFGERVASLVHEVTNIQDDITKYASKDVYIADKLRRIPWEVMLIKMVDRYDNIKDIPMTRNGMAYLEGTELLLEAAKLNEEFENHAVVFRFHERLSHRVKKRKKLFTQCLCLFNAHVD